VIAADARHARAEQLAADRRSMGLMPVQPLNRQRAARKLAGRDLDTARALLMDAHHVLDNVGLTTMYVATAVAGIDDAMRELAGDQG